MAVIPQPPADSQTVLAIYAAYEKRNKPRFSRRLGASIVGHQCARKVWYDFRWAGRENFSGRMLRLFDTGHKEEARFAEDLKSIGCEVHLTDPATGEQFEFTALGGHFVDKLDGAVVGVPEAPKAWHAAEFKTHSAKSFADLKKKGLRESKPDHYAQTIIGLRLSGMERSIYLARNKDTDELYSERFRLEETKEEADRLIDYATKIVEAKTPPARISDDRDKVPCRFCDHADRCHGSLPPSPAVPVLITCRSCVNATPIIEAGGAGRWVCEKHRKTLDVPSQEKACPDHLFIPDFIAFADVVDGGYDTAGDWILFENKDGSRWEHSKRKQSAYQSRELTVLPSPMVGCPGNGKVSVHDLKATLGAEVIEVVNQ